MIPVGDSDYEDVISGGKVIVEFTGDRCHFCRDLEQVIEQIKGEYQNITFAKYNTSDNHEMSDRFGIMSIPQLYFYRNGKLLDMKVGALDKAELEEAIKMAF